MKDSVIDRISQRPQEPQEHKPDDMLMKHDIKIMELDTRLRSLEQLCNAIHNQYGVWWDEIDDK